MSKINISRESPYSSDADLLMNELSDTLQSITGDSGRSSFGIEQMKDPGSIFVIARNEAGEAIGCGAIRPINSSTAEIKRMYAKYKSQGIGAAILTYLEEQSKSLGYSILWLETRVINDKAVKFYERNGYHRIPNYGKYEGNLQAVCYEKILNRAAEGSGCA